MLMRLQGIAQEISGAQIGAARAAAAGGGRHRQLNTHRSFLDDHSGDIAIQDQKTLGRLGDNGSVRIDDTTHRGAAVDHNVIFGDLDTQAAEQILHADTERHTNDTGLGNVAVDGQPLFRDGTVLIFVSKPWYRLTNPTVKYPLGWEKIKRQYPPSVPRTLLTC